MSKKTIHEITQLVENEKPKIIDCFETLLTKIEATNYRQSSSLSDQRNYLHTLLDLGLIHEFPKELLLEIVTYHINNNTG